MLFCFSIACVDILCESAKRIINKNIDLNFKHPSITWHEFQLPSMVKGPGDG